MSTAHLSPAQFKRRAAKHVPECDTQSAILQWLAIMKVRAVRIESAGQPIYGARQTGKRQAIVGLKQCSHVGMPDVYVALPWGQACHIEVKRAGEGKTGLRFSQARWIVETAKQSPWTMILIAESMLDVEEILRPMMNAWDHPTPAVWLVDFWHRECTGLTPWRTATAAAVATAKQRIARGPQ